MKIHLVNTTSGFLPASEEDIDKKMKLKNGEVYSADIKQPRNYKFHKKFFAMIGVVWENMPEEKELKFGTIDNFRYELTMKVGFREQWISSKGVLMFRAKSISFASMKQEEFDDLFNRCLDEIILNYSSLGAEKSALENEIMSFL